MGPVAIITGASRGIGQAIALSLARLDFNLVLNYVSRRDAAEETRNRCRENSKGAIELCQADIAEKGDRARLLHFTRERFGRLDLLVNNAGIAPQARMDLLETTEESFDRLMAVNARGPFFLTQAAAAWMIEQVKAGQSDYRPKIVIISSISASVASVNRGDYCLSKAALSMVTQLFAVRLADFGIGVFEVRPGIIATEMTAPVKDKYDDLIGKGLTPIRRWGKPDDVARAVAALAQDHFPFSTGDVFNVDGGFHLRTL